jgi:signal transduction histidine kinase
VDVGFLDVAVEELHRRGQSIVKLNERLKRDNVALDALNKELEAFSYSVSHDLRTPLRTIDGFSHVLQQDFGEQLDEAAKGYLDRIRQAAQRMGNLIDDLLQLSRISRADLRRERVDLSALAREIADALRAGAPERKLEFDIADGLEADCDPRLSRIALENLLNNACKYSVNRSPARIEFGQKQDDGVTAYYVRDNGAGFDMAYAGKLFGAFQRLHHDREFPGTGIGLATVQRIINKHGGRIWAQAEPGKGAIFSFTL